MDFSQDEALQRFETIWEHVECGICIVDAETREILAINPVAAQMFGDVEEEILGKRCHKFICPAEEHSCPIMDKGQTVDRSERKFVTANGETLPIIKSVAKIQYNGRLALLESFTDISNLKEAEEQVRRMVVTEQANRAKSDFLSRMSHEMRTPMNAIIGMVKLADNTSDLAKLRHCLSTIGVSAEHLLGLINDVLDMSKIEAGRFELEHTPFNIEQIMMKSVSLVAEQMEGKGLTLTVLFGNGMNMEYFGDELRVAQITTNLLSNAVKFTPASGRISIDVQETRKSNGTSILAFKVADTGIGMTQEQLVKLFDVFEQADTGIARRFGGTGLGLAICKTIVEKMSGHIDVQSEPGKGTTFFVEITVEPVPEARKKKKLLVGGRAPASVRLLVIDKDAEGRSGFKAVLNPWGLTADEAESMTAGLALVKAAQQSGKGYDAVFIEYNILQEAGAETIRRVCAGDTAPRVVAITSFVRWSKLDSTEMGLTEGLFITKPVFYSSVLTVLNSILQAADKKSPIGACVSPLPTTPDFCKIQLLLAEDIDINREIFCALLEDTKVNIDIAEDGSIAVEKFKAAPDKYDIIIMDVQMPNMGGYEATATIRALNIPRAKTIPIVAMTANVFKEDIEKSMASGMNDHLAKPIDEKKVIEKIALFCKDRVGVREPLI